VISLSRELDISTYDASYIEIGSRLGLALVTADRRLASAAAVAGLEVIDPASGD
jgi:predicted nucleic acid-binding protein